MERRKFLRASLSTWIVGCSARTEIAKEDHDSPPHSSWSGPIEVATDAFPQSVASGDPKPTSVILWTRAPGASVIYAQVARDEDFTDLVPLSDGTDLVSDLALDVRASHDFCVKLRVEQLQPQTTYYYRFCVETPNGLRSSRTGRTKTAPRDDADVGVRFAVLSCQDYSAYYHALRELVETAPDFVVHLGDYIYETADDPSFQAAGAPRLIQFRDATGALAVSVTPSEGQPARLVLAARSLDNYRQLYQTYRGDRWLQQLHETTPIIVVWDDHEFANDATGERTPATSTPDPERRLNADQAWFEYMPVDYPVEPALHDAPYPDNFRIYRDFRFGKHVHLVMTDLRRYRPPHLIAEDAFPGAVLADEETLTSVLGELPAVAQPYVDLDDSPHRELATVLQEAADGWGHALDTFTGKQDLAYLNTWIERYNTENPATPLQVLDVDTSAGRGIAAIHVGKTEAASSFGARYMVVQEVYELLAKVRYQVTSGASERLLGEEQREWFVQTLRSSDATWKVWGNEYTFLQKVVDLSALPVPDPRLQNRFLLSVEDWDGAPNERLALLSELSDVDNLVIVTGDIHSFFVGTPGVTRAPEATSQPLEFVCGAVSSATYERLLGTLINIDGFAELAPLAGAVLTLSNPHVTYSDLKNNGFASFEVSQDLMYVTFYAISSEDVAKSELPEPLSQHFAKQSFTWTKSGSLTRHAPDE